MTYVGLLLENHTKISHEKFPGNEPDVPEDAGTVKVVSVGPRSTVCDADGGSVEGDVSHTDTFHMGRPLRGGGVSQVTSIGRSSRDLL